MAILETDYWTTPTPLTKGIVKFLEYYKEIDWGGQYYDLDACANLHNKTILQNKKMLCLLIGTVSEYGVIRLIVEVMWIILLLKQWSNVKKVKKMLLCF